jgi:hypothetical protein
MTETIGLYIKNTIDFINKLPNNIAWIKNETGELKEANEGKEYYDAFFNRWGELNYTPQYRELAKKAEDIVYKTLLDNKPMYKHYEHSSSYELSEEAKKIRDIACDIYSYVIWLQMPDMFTDRTKKYMERIYNKWIHKEKNEHN